MATKAPGAAPPETTDLDRLSSAATGCHGCDLYRDATQTVFGEGPRSADVMVIGEQPGDHEDRAGAPFVGPAGRLLDRALDEAGFDRRKVHVTRSSISSSSGASGASTRRRRGPRSSPAGPGWRPN